MSPPADLYTQDFYAWTQTQAALLRKGAWLELDHERLIEEIEDMGHSQRDALGSHLIVLLTHLLKLESAPPHDLARAGRGWQVSCRAQRLRIAKLLRRNPRLRSMVSEECAEAYAIARLDALVDLDCEEAELPEACPWTPAQVLDASFFPESRCA